MDQFQLSRNGQVFGPMTVEQIQNGLNDGQVLSTDLAWREGMDGWETIQSLFDFEIIEEEVYPDESAPEPAAALPAGPLASGGGGRGGLTPPGRRRIPKPAEKRKIGFLGIAAILAGVAFFGFMVTTWAIGGAIETGVTEQVESIGDHKAVQVEQTFQRGITSSESRTTLFFAEENEEGLALKSTFYHGPVALTGEGPKLVRTYGVTRLDRTNWDPEIADAIDKAFGGKEPIEIHTSVKHSGDSTMEIRLASGEFQPQGGNAEVRFGGGTVFLDGDREGFTHLTGKVDLKGFSATVSGLEEMEWRSEPIVGNLNFKKGSHLQLTLGMEGIEVKSDSGSFQVSKPQLKVDSRQLAPDSAVMVGSTVFSIPKIQGGSPMGEVSMSDLSFRQEMKEAQGGLHGFARYELGGIDLNQDPNAAGMGGPGAMFGQYLNGGLSLEVGARGINTKALEAMTEHSSRMNGLWWAGFRQGIQDGFGPAGEAPAMNSETERGLQEASTEIALQMLELFQPGVSVYTQLDVSKGAAGAYLDLGMGGAKKLTEMTTLREILSSITGTLKADVGQAFMQDPMIQGMLTAQADRGMGMIDPQGYHLLGELKDGVAHLSGQPTPLLDALGPMLDEKIDWETIISGIRSGPMGN